MRGPVIDTTRTVTIESDVYGTDPETPRGFFIVEFDPVRELNEGNGYYIWPCGPFETAGEAQTVLDEARQE